MLLNAVLCVWNEEDTHTAAAENEPRGNTAFTFDIQQYFEKFEKKTFIDPITGSFWASAFQ